MRSLSSLLVGIDPGSEQGLGWAVWDLDKDQLLASGVAKIPKGKDRDRSPVWQAIFGLLEEHQPIAVAYEQVMRHSSVYAAHLYGGQQAMIQFWCAYRGSQSVLVSVQAIKKALGCTASGKAKQKAMPAAARALGFEHVQDHNEADAIGTCLAAKGVVQK